MSRERAFAEALDAALDAVRRGASIASAIERYPEQARELLPLLRVADAIHEGSAPAPSARLAQNIRHVRLAVHAERERRTAPWWRRPISFASMSVPAGILALAAIGGAGAAAGGAAVVATTTDLPAIVERAATLDFDSGNATNAPGHGGDLPGAPGGPADAGKRAATPQPDTGRPTAISISGTIRDARGNSFTLSTADGDWHVNVDASTTVSGTIADGAQAAVDGDQTGDRNLHAAHVAATAPLAPVATATPPGNSDNATPPRQVATPPGQAKTPERGRDETRTPSAESNGRGTPQADVNHADSAQ